MPNNELKVYAVLLAGGSGTRLWPASRQLYPKQLIKFIGENSLIQNTAKRLTPAIEIDNILVVCGNDHYHEIVRHMTQIGIQAAEKTIREPCGRNTAPAVLLSVYHVLDKEDDAVICVFPADHVIGDVKEFHNKLDLAVRLAENGSIVTFGIKPHYPETGYGYIEAEKLGEKGALKVKKFREKPNRETAEEYIEAGNFFWNSGMFVFKASVMCDEFKTLAPNIYEAMAGIWAKGKQVAFEDYSLLPNTSIDYAIMEKTAKAVIIPSDFGWSDIGSWKSLYDFLPKDKNGNVIDGDVMVKNAAGCFIMGRERLIAASRVNNLVIVDTPDSVFVSDLEHSKEVKSFVNQLKKKNRRECRNHNREITSWGSRTILESKDGRKVTRVKIQPGGQMDFQKDESAIQRIVVVEGEGRLVGETENRLVSVGDCLDIGSSAATGLENSGEIALIFFHVQAFGDSAVEKNR